MNAQMWGMLACVMLFACLVVSSGWWRPVDCHGAEQQRMVFSCGACLWVQAAVSRRLLGHCQLPWEDAVLDFHATKRTVQTASLGQARPHPH